MTKLYKKSELAFALVWIAVYVVGFSLADGISASVGMEKCFTAPLCVILCAILLAWIRRHALSVTFGLTKFRGNPAHYLYFIPLVLIVSVNLWCGITLRLSIPETALYILTMLGVGFLEEIIFRGFLFRALCRDSMKTAVIVSSVTFGIGHIVNLLNGAPLLPTLLQIVYAVAAGFLFTIIFLRSGSLLPCILTHSAINALSAVAAEPSPAMRVVTAAALTVIAIGYACFILKAAPKDSGKC